MIHLPWPETSVHNAESANEEESSLQNHVNGDPMLAAKIPLIGAPLILSAGTLDMWLRGRFWMEEAARKTA